MPPCRGVTPGCRWTERGGGTCKHRALRPRFSLTTWASPGPTPECGRRRPRPRALTGWRCPAPGRRRRSRPRSAPASSTTWQLPARQCPRPPRPGSSAAPGKRPLCCWCGLDFPQIAIKGDSERDEIPQILKGSSQQPANSCSRTFSLGSGGTWHELGSTGARRPGFEAQLGLPLGTGKRAQQGAPHTAHGEDQKGQGRKACLALDRGPGGCAKPTTGHTAEPDPLSLAALPAAWHRLCRDRSRPLPSLTRPLGRGVRSGCFRGDAHSSPGPPACQAWEQPRTC